MPYIPLICESCQGEKSQNGKAHAISTFFFFRMYTTKWLSKIILAVKFFLVMPEYPFFNLYTIVYSPG